MLESTSNEAFRKNVLDSSIPVLVEFWAPWCKPCKKVGEILDQIRSKIGEKLKILRLNVDENPKVADFYEIRAVSTVILFYNGRIIKRFVGIQDESKYLEALEILQE